MDTNGTAPEAAAMRAQPEAFIIPTIDISPYLADPTSEAASKVVADVRLACMTTGFFSLVGHNVDKGLQQSVLRACDKLFRLPLDEKRSLVSPGGRLKNRGYEIIGSQVLQEGALPDLKEVYLRSLALLPWSWILVSPVISPALCHQTCGC